MYLIQRIPISSLNNSIEQGHVFDVSWSFVCISKSYFVLASLFSAGSRLQKGNAINQMCILTLPNHGSIHYTNMGERNITLALCVWDACIMHSSRDIKVYHCYSGLVAACPAWVTNSTICVSIDPQVVLHWCLPWRFYNITSKWHTFCPPSQQLCGYSQSSCQTCCGYNT